jgi:hypothetical protein
MPRREIRNLAQQIRRQPFLSWIMIAGEITLKNCHVHSKSRQDNASAQVTILDVGRASHPQSASAHEKAR